MKKIVEPAGKSRLINNFLTWGRIKFFSFITKNKIKFSRRTYDASLKWRQNGGQWRKDPCYCITTRIERPEDVLSDEEPLLTEDQSKWAGRRVERTEFPDQDASQYFG